MVNFKMKGISTMKIKALAHRGYPMKYPENTIKSFEESYKLGFSHIELDVQLSKDKVPVLMHDQTINRTTNGSGMVSDYTVQELKKFQTKKGAEKIPTLEEARTFAKGKMKVAVELKQFGNQHKGIEEKVLKVIQQTDMMDQVYVNSFHHFTIIKMRELSEEVELGLIQSGPTPAVIPVMKELRMKYLSLPVHQLYDEYVEMCEEAGITIVTWPVDTEEQFLKSHQYDSVLDTTNDLEEYRRLYKKYKNN